MKNNAEKLRQLEVDRKEIRNDLLEVSMEIKEIEIRRLRLEIMLAQTRFEESALKVRN